MSGRYFVESGQLVSYNNCHEHLHLEGVEFAVGEPEPDRWSRRLTSPVILSIRRLTGTERAFLMFAHCNDRWDLYELQRGLIFVFSSLTVVSEEVRTQHRIDEANIVVADRVICRATLVESGRDFYMNSRWRDTERFNAEYQNYPAPLPEPILANIYGYARDSVGIDYGSLGDFSAPMAIYGERLIESLRVPPDIFRGDMSPTKVDAKTEEPAPQPLFKRRRRRILKLIE